MITDMKKIKFQRLILAIRKVIDNADDTGCDGDLTVTSKKAVDALEKEISSLFVDGDMPLLDQIQSVCLMANNLMETERRCKFEGWDKDDIADSEKALKAVKKFFNV